VLAVSNVLSLRLCGLWALRLSLPQRRGEPQRYAEKTFEAKAHRQSALGKTTPAKP
jgi:hypothetical protein